MSNQLLHPQQRALLNLIDPANGFTPHFGWPENLSRMKGHLACYMQREWHTVRNVSKIMHIYNDQVPLRPLNWCNTHDLSTPLRHLLWLIHSQLSYSSEVYQKQTMSPTPLAFFRENLPFTNSVLKRSAFSWLK